MYDCRFLSGVKSCLKQIQNVRVVHSTGIGTPHMEECSPYLVSTVHFRMNLEHPIHRFAYNLICLKVANALWQSWYQVRPKQWRAVGLAELLKTSTYQREICVLTPCPRAEQSRASAMSLWVTDLVSKLFASGMSLGL